MEPAAKQHIVESLRNQLQGGTRCTLDTPEEVRLYPGEGDRGRKGWRVLLPTLLVPLACATIVAIVLARARPVPRVVNVQAAALEEAEGTPVRLRLPGKVQGWDLGTYRAFVADADGLRPWAATLVGSGGARTLVGRLPAEARPKAVLLFVGPGAGPPLKAALAERLLITGEDLARRELRLVRFVPPAGRRD